MPSLPLAASKLLPVFARHAVRFIVVGGVAAVAQGAPILTKDLDLLIDTAEDNLDAILAACAELGAAYYDPAGRKILPDREKLLTLRLHLLRSPVGQFDLLREIGPGLRFTDLLPKSLEIDLSGSRVRILALETVIETKRFANRAKDRAVLPVLEEVLRLAEHVRGRDGDPSPEE